MMCGELERTQTLYPRGEMTYLGKRAGLIMAIKCLLSFIQKNDWTSWWF